MELAVSSPFGEAALVVLLVGNYANDRQESMQRFATVLAQELPKHGIIVEMCRPTPFFGRLKSSAFGVGKWLGYLDKFLVFPVVLKKRIRNIRRHNEGNHIVFLVHICDHSNAMYIPYLRAVRNLVTCNDMLAIRSAKSEIKQNVTRWSGQKFQAMILRGLNEAQAVACISEATRGDLLRLSKLAYNQVRVIYMGQNYCYTPLARVEAQRVIWDKVRGCIETMSWPSGSSFILHVGGNQWYKNRIGVLQIYDALLVQLIAANERNLPKLVMIGPELTASLKEFIERHVSLKEQVVSLQGLDNEELRAFYSAAELLLFPSLEEGFGWPLIEAQACGCRVVTTGKAPMTEVGGSSCVYVDAALLNGEEGIDRAARTVRVLLDEKGPKRDARISAGLQNAALFSTERMISEYVSLYRKVCG